MFKRNIWFKNKCKSKDVNGEEQGFAENITRLIFR